ncbi:hypothetical protein [Phytoactinopolyspora halotolerans]|uniref:Bacterial transcriptional activator domain-containing protein n=1 Tax=Phytoactinopolyspora halotolerans TaxID=1981512 RepID=A0A6L9SDU1_9ACTN|nr:hypothetical protein [Phytoactinopolyspora halotolerans]NEE02784.1 hypothetical protein [Phytoactinopolyspora halotolerans]
MNQVDDQLPPPPPPPPPVGMAGTASTTGSGEVRERGPQRFQRADPSARTERSLPAAFGAGFALLALVVGVPVGLLLLAGPPPVPTSWPTRDDLTAAIGVEQLVGVLMWIVWLAWLQFTVCVLVELRSAVRGVGIPSRVPMSSASQRMARLLVGAVMLAVTAVGQASAAVPATMPEAPSSVQSATYQADAAATADDSAGVQATVHGSDEQADAKQRDSGPSDRAVYRLGDMVLDPDDGKELLGKKVYVVQPPEGRYHDNLWDIAERTLGEGRRYSEIFELNKGRTQPDGHELSLARLIYPNWLIVLPEDAVGVDTVTYDEPEAETEPEADAPVSPERAEGTDETDASTSDGERGAHVDQGAGDGSGTQTERDLLGVGFDRTPSEQGAEGQVSDAAGGWTAHAELVGAGLLGAGLLASIEVVRRRRRMPEPSGDGVEAEVALRIGADPDRARWLDHALRSLAAACRDAGLSLPASYAAVVDDQSVELLLAPPREQAPQPWSVADGGRRWLLRRETVAASAEGRSRPGAPAPYPGLVSLGRDGDRDVLLDLEAAGGPISIGGDPAAAFEVATAVAVELATNCWSDRLRVTAAAMPDELTVFDPERLRVVEDLAEALPELRTRRAAGEAPDVLRGRLRPDGDGVWTAEYVVSGSAPDGELMTELAELTDSAGRSPVGVVCAGEFAGARWRLSVDSAGSLQIPVLGVNVRANRLSWRSVEALADLVAPAPSGDGPQSPGGQTGWLPDVRPEVPTPPAELDVADLATAPVRVFILGPAEVQANRPIADDRRELATEIVVYLALHRDGVHPAVLSASIWPRGVGTSVLDATLDRVRQWLGTDPEGSPYLLETPDGRLKLSERALLDWDVVCSLLRRSRRAQRVQEEIDLLSKALRVARGPVLTERPTGRYSWLARARVERVATDVLVDAAHRLSALYWDGGDPGAASAAASAGLRVRPGEQLLWRDLLQARHAVDGSGGLATAAAEMSAMLRAIGVADLSPETEALLEELSPGSSRQMWAPDGRDSA